jgi:hypothetical protein
MQRCTADKRRPRQPGLAGPMPTAPQRTTPERTSMATPRLLRGPCRTDWTRRIAGTGRCCTRLTRACYCVAAQPAGLNTRSLEAGNLPSLATGRRGRATSSPPQLGHCPRSTPLAHGSQNVHSKEQMRASADSGGRSRLQHSQFGRSWSIGGLGWCCLTFDMSGGPKGAKRPLARPLDGEVRLRLARCGDDRQLILKASAQSQFLADTYATLRYSRPSRWQAA